MFSQWLICMAQANQIEAPVYIFIGRSSPIALLLATPIHLDQRSKMPKRLTGHYTFCARIGEELSVRLMFARPSRRKCKHLGFVCSVAVIFAMGLFLRGTAVPQLVTLEVPAGRLAEVAPEPLRASSPQAAPPKAPLLYVAAAPNTPPIVHESSNLLPAMVQSSSSILAGFETIPAGLPLTDLHAEGVVVRSRPAAAPMFGGIYPEMDPRCSECKPGGDRDGDVQLVGGVCHAFCSTAGFCGGSQLYAQGLDCRKQPMFRKFAFWATPTPPALWTCSR